MRTILLACDHEKEVDKVEELVFCKICGHAVKVKSQGFQVKCQDCTFVRYYGIKTDFSAKVFASKHALVRRHTVHVVDTLHPDNEPTIVTGTQPDSLFDQPPY